LNAVIRSAVLSGIGRGWEMVGVQKGFGGFLGEGEVIPLDADSVRGITHLGGTMLGTTNRGNPFRWGITEGGQSREIDRSDEVMQALHHHRLDGLIVIGGDGSLAIARDLSAKGAPIVGVPKTIDNDVGATHVTFGFHTAVATATEAIGRLHSTAESHSRVMVVEVMGRHAGWIALYAGLAGTADAILIPEIPFKIDRVCDKIREREAYGNHFSIVVVAEGAVPVGGVVSLVAEAESGTVARLGGLAGTIADAIAEQTGKETRSLNLGHLQRGGSPTAYDRILALRFGAAAIRAIERNEFGHIVAYQPPEIVTVPFDVALGQLKPVEVDGDVVQTARDLGVSFGD
jgi:phosphofructokinase-like protein